MIYSPKIQKAIKFSAKTHNQYQDQKRKGKLIPYIIHPLTVGIILVSAKAKEEVVVAGILHDTVEDSIADKKVTPEMLQERFGKEVCDLVLSVTEMNKKLSWEERKEQAFEHICNFSNDSLLVKSADIVANVSELVDDYAREKEVVFSRFSAPKEKIIKHQLKTIGAIVQKWDANPLKKDLAFLSSQLQKMK